MKKTPSLFRGKVQRRTTGRPEDVYGPDCKPEEIEHEFWLTEAELLVGPFDRQWKIGNAIADGFFQRDGNDFAVEVDNHSMTSRQMREKWGSYGDYKGYILVICHSMSRLQNLIRGAERVKTQALFSLFHWLKSGMAEKWIDWTGERVEV